MHTPARTAPWLVALLLATNGCGDETTPDAADPAADPSSSEAQSGRPGPPRARPDGSTELPTTPQTPRPPSGPSDVIERSTITGTLHRAGDCAELVGPGGRWVVLDLPERWRAGSDLVVTGIARPERSTTCEGIPFAFSAVREFAT